MGGLHPGGSAKGVGPGGLHPGRVCTTPSQGLSTVGGLARQGSASGGGSAYRGSASRGSAQPPGLPIGGGARLVRPPSLCKQNDTLV